MHRRHRTGSPSPLFALLAGLGLAWLTGGAHGEAAAQAAPPLSTQGSPGCAVRPDFEAEVERLVGARHASGAPERIDVRLHDTSAGVRVELRVARGRTRSRRTLVLAGCAAANDAAVLLTALAIDPNAQLPEPAATGVPEPVTGPEPIREPVTGPEPVREPVTEPARATEPVRAPEPVTSRVPATGRADAATRSALGRSFKRAFLVRVAGALDPRQLDGPSAALSGELGLGLGPLEAALGGRYTLPRPLDALPNGADVTLSTAHGTSRLGVRFVRGAFALIPAATLSLGSLRVDADTVRVPAVRHVLIADVGLGAQGEWALTRHIAVDLGAELVLPLRRPVLALDGAQVFALPAVAGRITLGLRFWTLRPTSQP